MKRYFETGYLLVPHSWSLQSALCEMGVNLEKQKSTLVSYRYACEFAQFNRSVKVFCLRIELNEVDLEQLHPDKKYIITIPDYDLSESLGNVGKNYDNKKKSGMMFESKDLLDSCEAAKAMLDLRGDRVKVYEADFSIKEIYAQDDSAVEAA